MERYADLKITGNRENIEAFLNEPSILSGGWERDTESEDRLNRNSGMSVGRYFAFQSPRPSMRHDLVPACVFICPDTEDATGGTYEVVNITPNETGELSHEEYDALLKAFYEDNLQGKTRDYDLLIERQPGKFTAEDLVKEGRLSQASLDKLRSWSRAAPPYAPMSHPLDKRRWWEFIISCVISDEILDVETLQSLLVDEGWDEDKARGLSHEYEKIAGFYNYATSGRKNSDA